MRTVKVLWVDRVGLSWHGVSDLLSSADIVRFIQQTKLQPTFRDFSACRGSKTMQQNNNYSVLQVCDPRWHPGCNLSRLAHAHSKASQLHT